MIWSFQGRNIFLIFLSIKNKTKGKIIWWGEIGRGKKRGNLVNFDVKFTFNLEF